MRGRALGDVDAMARLGSIVALAALAGCAARGPAVPPASPGWSTVQALPPGTEVRVETGGAIRRGRIESVALDALVLRVGKASQPIARRDIERVYERVVIGQGKRLANVLLGVVGWTVVAGVVIAAGDVDDGKAKAVGTAAAIGAVSGAVYPTRFYGERVIYIRW